MILAEDNLRQEYFPQKQIFQVYEKKLMSRQIWIYLILSIFYFQSHKQNYFNSNEVGFKYFFYDLLRTEWNRIPEVKTNKKTVYFGRFSFKFLKDLKSVGIGIPRSRHSIQKNRQHA